MSDVYSSYSKSDKEGKPGSDDMMAGRANHRHLPMLVAETSAVNSLMCSIIRLTTETSAEPATSTPTSRNSYIFVRFLPDSDLEHSTTAMRRRMTFYDHSKQHNKHFAKFFIFPPRDISDQPLVVGPAGQWSNSSFRIIFRGVPHEPTSNH